MIALQVHLMAHADHALGAYGFAKLAALAAFGMKNKLKGTHNTFSFQKLYTKI